MNLEVSFINIQQAKDLTRDNKIRERFQKTVLQTSSSARENNNKEDKEQQKNKQKSPQKHIDFRF